MLGYIVEAIGKGRFGMVIDKHILTPLNLKSSYTSKPSDDGLGAIPVNSNTTGWDDDIGDEMP